MRSQIEEALASGYSPAEVLDYLSKSEWQDKVGQITKAKEAGYSPDEILDYLTPKKIETAGPIEAAIGSTKRMGADIITGAQLPFDAKEAALEGISRQKDITEKSAGSLEAVKQAYEDKGVLGAAKEVISQAPGVIAEQAPLIGSMALGARAGAVAGPYGALAGSVLLPLLSYAGASAERKAEEQINKDEPVNVDATGAFASGAGQAALDRLSLGFSGLARVFGISAKELATETGAKLAKESFGKALAKGTLKTELAEIPTEIAQQAIERYYAGLPLTGEDALKEYGDIAYQTSLMGPLGGMGRVYERGEQRDIIKQQEQTQQRELSRIDAERARIDQIVLDAQNEAEIVKAKEEAKKFAIEELNTLGNKAPEKSKIAKSIANMEASFNKAIEQQDIDAQKAAIAELTNIPTNIVSLAQQYQAKPTDIISPQTFKNLNIGPTAAIRKSLTGLDPLKLEDNATIRQAFDAFLKNKEDDAPQSVAIRQYLDTIPKPEELQNEATIVKRPGESVQVPGQPMAGELAGGVEGVDGTGLGGTSADVQQLAGREEPSPAPLEQVAPEEIIKQPKAKPAMGIQAFLKQHGGVNISHLEDLTGETSINKSGATVGLFTKNGQGLDDAVQVALDGGYLSPAETKDVDGGMQALRDLIEDEIRGKKAIPLGQQGDAELEAYLAREEQKKLMQEVTPTEAPKTEEEINKELAEAASVEKDIQYGPPQTSQFKNWFGNSKVVDKKGTPKVMYHATSANFDTFNTNEKALMGEGSWFSFKPYDQYVKNETGYKDNANIIPSYLSLKNPKVIRIGKDSQDFNKQKLIKEGYDGVVNVYDGEIRTAVAFYPNQIKSAIGNKGTFDVTKESILEGAKQQLGERNPIFDKVTNAKQLFKAVMKIADTRSDKAIINMLEKVPNLETVKVITENTSTNPELQGASGYFDPNTNTIFVDPRVTDLSHITLHEIAHAATDAEFDKHVKIENNVSTPLTPLGKKIVKLFDAFMEESLKKQEGFYAQKNPKEFFMEAYTDDKLKNFLQNRAGVLGLKPAKGKIATMWSDFVNLIKSMFGIPEYAHSMLDEILLLSPELMKGPGEVTTGKEVSQARRAPEGLTRPDGTPLKYFEADQDSLWQKTKNAYDNKRKWLDVLGNKIIGNRYSVERKGIDANLPEVDALREGRMRGDLVNLQATNKQSLAQSGLYHGRLDVRKSGMIIADQSTGDRKVGMLDISKAWYELLDRATQDLGSQELAYDMLTAGWYGPRYADLERYNQTVPRDEQIDISEWTDSDKRTAAEAQRRYGDELRDIRDMRNIQRKDLLDFMVKSGLYTRDKAQKYLDRMDYVALYRVPEEEIDSYDNLPVGRSAGLLGAGKEYRLVGSKRAAADPIDNYIQNMSWMMQRGIQNNAAIHTADMLQNIDQGKWLDRPATDIERKKLHVIPLYVDGKKKDFIVDDPNDMAAFMGSPVISGLVWDLMRYPVSGLRHGITMMPQFVWNQANEDPIRATIASGNKAGFTRNYIDAWTSILNNQFKADRTPNAELLNRYGIVGQKDVLDSQDVINLYKGKNKTGWRKYVLYLERMAQGSDLGAREAIFKNAIKELTDQGYDLETAQDYAAVRAHQYMPYQQVGTSRSLAYLRRMMPFINPPIQGLARDIAAARGRVGNMTRAQGKKALAWRLTKYAMFTAMYAAFMSGDDDYESKTDDQQDNNFYIAGTRVPVPTEIRPLKVAIERGTRAYVNTPGADVDNSAMTAAVLRKFWEVVAGFVPMPTIARPVAENIANYDIFTGLPVVGPGQQRKEPAYQYTENTSEVAKVIGAQLNYSPIKVDHIIKGYGGYMGQTIAQMTNYLSSDRPAPTVNQMLFIGSMLEGEHDTGARGDFYELYDKTSTVKATAQALKSAGDIEGFQNYMQKNKGFMAVAPTVSNLHNQLTKLRQYRNQIVSSSMTPEEKREALDGLAESENNMLSNIKDLHRQALEINKQD